MKFVNKIELHTDEIEEKFYGRTGEFTDNKKERNYAKTKAGIDVTEIYFVRVYNKSLYDPLMSSGRRVEYEETEYKLVSKETFDFYMLYLKTNNSLYFTRAQRGFVS